jgi:FixJ family two-component response regulator
MSRDGNTCAFTLVRLLEPPFPDHRELSRARIVASRTLTLSISPPAAFLADTRSMTNREIAHRLGITQHTVSNYLFRIYDKLGISSRVELVLYVFKQSRRA